MTTPQTRSLEQKLLSRSRNVFVVVLLTYFPFLMIAYSMDILVAFICESFIYGGTTALDHMLFNLKYFLSGWIWIKLGHTQPHIIAPIAWGLCCLYHRRLVFNLPRKTFWFFASALLFFWIYTPLWWIYRSYMRDKWYPTGSPYLLIAVSILTVLFCWWLVERRRAKLLPEE